MSVVLECSVCKAAREQAIAIQARRKREHAKAQLVRIRKHKPHLLDVYPEFKKARMKLLAEVDRDN